MSTNETDGPLTKLSKLLGLDPELPAIAAVKRIDVMPRRLNIPEDFTNTEINRMIDEGVTPIPVNLPEIGLVPELFFSTTKRHRPDILECNDCGEQFPADVCCPKCESKNLSLFMRAPSREEVRQHFDRESQLTELDPDWKERFGGDEERARDFYKTPAKIGHVVSGNGNDSPLEYSTPRYEDPDEDVDFDSDLEDRP